VARESRYWAEPQAKDGLSQPSDVVWGAGGALGGAWSFWAHAGRPSGGHRRGGPLAVALMGGLVVAPAGRQQVVEDLQPAVGQTPAAP
jgi:hypothetical protein